MCRSLPWVEGAEGIPGRRDHGGRSHGAWKRLSCLGNIEKFSVAGLVKLSLDLIPQAASSPWRISAEDDVRFDFGDVLWWHQEKNKEQLWEADT